MLMENLKNHNEKENENRKQQEKEQSSSLSMDDARRGASDLLKKSSLSMPSMPTMPSWGSSMPNFNSSGFKMPKL